MKTPRDLSATQLIKILAPLGYKASRQTGSHIRLTTLENGQHHITIPNHDPIKIGTLNKILADVALHIGLSKQELIDRIF
jgi:predicted RNA binding protein YcfA (HicA-like mRNA interferase family)